uniref:Peptidase M12A domain-containing protein n=1 Tax=Acrobeloides nanus TaxID=290746 RepID=A0A914CCN2_9BILA
MIMLKFLWFISIGYYVDGYATNFKEKLKWPNNTVKYIISHTKGNQADFQKLVNRTLENFQQVFGDYIRWVEVPACDVKPQERHVIFRNFEKLHFEKCGFSTTNRFGPSIIELPFDYDNRENCTDSDRFYLILWVLGFTPTHWRYDRDIYITIEWDNIRPIDREFYEKRSDLMNSTNEAFKIYDICSLLHPPTGDNPNKPSIKPKNDSKLYCMVERGLRNVTKSDIKQFRAIYGA